jgi:polyhydroxyalkanoate synthesis regulator phasin
MADSSATNQLFELWRRQFEESAAAWTRLAGQATPPQPSDPTAFWRPILNQGLEQWARLFSQGPITPDLAAQWKQFLDQWIEAWSKALGQAMNTEAYAEMMGKFLDQQLVAQGPMKKAAEQSIEGALQALNLPSRGQVTNVARQIVELEERIERLEDGIGEILKRLEAKEPA